MSDPDLPAITQRATVTLDDGRTYRGTVRHLDVGRDTIVGMAPGPTTLELKLVVEERGRGAPADLAAIEALIRSVKPGAILVVDRETLAALVERVRGLEAENAALREVLTVARSYVAASASSGPGAGLLTRIDAALRRTP